MSATAPNRYLTGNAAPVAETTAFDLLVTGRIPDAFEGRWLRNGPNPVEPLADPEKHHWFLGTGMVHGVRLRGGKAEWYRNRTVLPDQPFGANTSVGGFAGTTWALVEGGQPPVELGYELDTIGANRFFDTLAGPFSAHPKYDPATGELHAMCYRYPEMSDRLHYVVVDVDGRVIRTVDVPVPDMPMVHDMSLTDTYAVVYDQPVTVSIERALEGFPFPMAWNPDHPPRVGLLPRAAARSTGTADAIVWCDAPQKGMFHPVNAYDTPDGKVVIHLCAYDRLFDSDRNGPGDTHARLEQWIVDPATGTTAATVVNDERQEFPRHNPAVALREYRYAYTAETVFGSEGFDGTGNVHGATIKTDLVTGRAERHDYGPHRGGAEPVFVARPGGTAEDDGWLITLVYDSAEDRSELHLLNADDLSAGPEAIISLPQRVPFGFHGDWVPDHRVGP